MSKDELGKKELELITIYEELIKGETSSVRKRRHLRQLLNRHKRICQPEVDEAFIEKWLGKLSSGGGGHGYPTFWDALETMLQEAGVKIKK